jgi:hypothetical protein
LARPRRFDDGRGFEIRSQRDWACLGEGGGCWLDRKPSGGGEFLIGCGRREFAIVGGRRGGDFGECGDRGLRGGSEYGHRLLIGDDRGFLGGSGCWHLLRGGGGERGLLIEDGGGRGLSGCGR